MGVVFFCYWDWVDGVGYIEICYMEKVFGNFDVWYFYVICGFNFFMNFFELFFDCGEV